MSKEDIVHGDAQLTETVSDVLRVISLRRTMGEDISDGVNILYSLLKPLAEERIDWDETKKLNKGEPDRSKWEWVLKPYARGFIERFEELEKLYSSGKIQTLKQLRFDQVELIIKFLYRDGWAMSTRVKEKIRSKQKSDDEYGLR